MRNAVGRVCTKIFFVSEVDFGDVRQHVLRIQAQEPLLDTPPFRLSPARIGQFDHPFCILLNVAVGNDCRGVRDAATVLFLKRCWLIRCACTAKPRTDRKVGNPAAIFYNQ